MDIQSPRDEEAYIKTMASRLQSAHGVLQAIQTALSVVLSFTTLIVLVGFFIVNIYLFRATDLVGFNVVGGRYISTGISLVIWFMLILGLFSLYKPVRNFIFLPIPSRINKTIVNHRIEALQHQAEMINEEYQALCRDTYGYGEPGESFETTDEIERKLAELEHIQQRIISESNIINNDNVYVKRKTRIKWLAITVAFLFSSWIYALLWYPVLPHVFGGGLSVTITLSIRSEYSLLSLGLSQASSTSSNTSTVWLLAELTDGILVADQTTGKVVAIKNDIIAAIMDDGFATSLIVPTETPTATFTPAPTETPTP